MIKQASYIHRWLAEEGIKIASEKKMRSLSKEIISVEVLADIAPFTRSLKGGGEEMKASMDLLSIRQSYRVP